MDSASYTLADIDLVFDLLVSPTYQLRNEWSAYLRKRYMDPSDERLYYFDMMEISAMIVKRFQKKRAKTLQQFFKQVDMLLQKGDFEIRNLLLAGLIEGIQQICVYNNVDMRYDFDAWLLPHTKKNWDELAYGFYGPGKDKL